MSLLPNEEADGLLTQRKRQNTTIVDQTFELDKLNVSKNENWMIAIGCQKGIKNYQKIFYLKFSVWYFCFSYFFFAKQSDS